MVDAGIIQNEGLPVGWMSAAALQLGVTPYTISRWTKRLVLLGILKREGGRAKVKLEAGCFEGEAFVKPFAGGRRKNIHKAPVEWPEE